MISLTAQRLDAKYFEARGNNNLGVLLYKKTSYAEQTIHDNYDFYCIKRSMNDRCQPRCVICFISI